MKTPAEWIAEADEPWLQVKGTLALAKAAAWGFLQVLFVSLTTVAIVKHNYIANFAGSLAVNVFWLYNVKTATAGSKGEKWAYALGAATGSVAGAFLGHSILT